MYLRSTVRLADLRQSDIVAAESSVTSNSSTVGKPGACRQPLADTHVEKALSNIPMRLGIIRLIE